MLDAKQQTGLNPTLYLRNVNVRWGGFDLADLGTMDVLLPELDRISAVDGDVIMCEGGEPGRCAAWRGEPIALQKALHRMRPHDGVLADFLAHVLRQLAGSGALAAYFTGSTIKHLPKQQLRNVSVRLPSPEVQATAVRKATKLMRTVDSVERQMHMALKRTTALRRSILAAAFAGRLVPQDPGDEPAAVLLERIRSERG